MSTITLMGMSALYSSAANTYYHFISIYRSIFLLFKIILTKTLYVVNLERSVIAEQFIDVVTYVYLMLQP